MGAFLPILPGSGLTAWRQACHSHAEVADFKLLGPAGPYFKSKLRKFKYTIQTEAEPLGLPGPMGTHAAVPFRNSSTAWQ